jgi:deoxyribodipyrimidine photo-lyase
MANVAGLAIWWVRRDFRLTDNSALEAAADAGLKVLPVFIMDPVLMNSMRASTKRVAFMNASLHSMDLDLRQSGGRLLVRQGNPKVQLARILAESGAKIIFAQRDYSPYSIRRDKDVASVLPLTLLPGIAAVEPGLVTKPDGSPYVVFSAFFKAWRSSLNALPLTSRLVNEFDGQPSLDSASLPTADAVDGFPVGNQAAVNRAESFLKEALRLYKKGRESLDGSGASRVSPYLRFGVLSPMRLALNTAESESDEYLRQIAWRDFYISILARDSSLAFRNGRSEFDGMPWNTSDIDFNSWATGETGYPLVDAGMRQLASSGWVSNRVRMIVASFLTKHLLIDWRMGEAHFMRHLLDGDVSSNAGGWQWVAGTGSDRAPYFRIFSPIAQGKRYDSEGDYVKQWIPELQGISSKWVHEPWRMPFPPVNYPPPIVDHTYARQRALDAFASLRKKKPR